MTVSFVVITAVAWASIATSFIVIRSNRRLIDENRGLRATAFAATVLVNALAERNVAIRCDDCGNEMYPSDQIDIMPRPDGGMYVGHSSHNRKHDWGLVDD